MSSDGIPEDIRDPGDGPVCNLEGVIQTRREIPIPALGGDTPATSAEARSRDRMGRSAWTLRLFRMEGEQ